MSGVRANMFTAMYENHADRLLPQREFLVRLARHGGLASIALLISLAIGTLGFHSLASQDWLDAFLNSCMLLGGMGLVGEVNQPSGKVFAAFYALYAGIVFLGISALLLAPILHRVIHRLHLDERKPDR